MTDLKATNINEEVEYYQTLIMAINNDIDFQYKEIESNSKLLSGTKNLRDIKTLIKIINNCTSIIEQKNELKNEYLQKYNEIIK